MEWSERNFVRAYCYDNKLVTLTNFNFEKHGFTEYNKRYNKPIRSYLRIDKSSDREKQVFGPLKNSTNERENDENLSPGVRTKSENY